jgi:hypothetical protein
MEINVPKEKLEKHLQETYGKEIKVTEFSIKSSEEDENIMDVKISIIPIKPIEHIEQTIVIKKTNDEALGYQKEIKRLQKRIDKYLAPLNKQIRDLDEKLHLVCIHNETEEKHEYESGSYYDKCKYIDKTVCKVCGKVINEEVTYGGFN